MSLQELQAAFWRAVRYDPAPSDALSHFRGDARLGAAGRMKVYRDMYWFRQVDALREGFPKLSTRLGDRRFTELACAYIRKHPSQHPTLEHLGHALPAFMAERTPEHAGLARLEWARTLALLAPDPEAIGSPQDADPQTFPVAKLNLVPSLRVVEVDGRALAEFEQDGELPPDGASVAVWRRGFGVRQLVLPSNEAEALMRVVQRATVAEILTGFATDSEGITRAFEMIRAWFSHQWIESIDTTP